MGEDGIKDKLIKTKERWAREGRLLTGAEADPALRLPPGQHEVKNWPVLDLGAQPDIAPGKWHLRVDGLVQNKIAWRYADLLAQPQTRQVCGIHCVTSWSRYDMPFEGVSALHLLSVVQPLPQARHLMLHSFDGYTTNLPLELFAAPDVLIAHSAEGRALTREHGGPVRLVVPKLYFWKSAKWISRLSFLAEERPGFWEERGYHRIGDPWKEERYS
jgi:DMSO/TMAO reductase YedYZ molybdopterin-dependent catalytic subunit